MWESAIIVKQIRTFVKMLNKHYIPGLNSTEAKAIIVKRFVDSNKSLNNPLQPAEKLYRLQFDLLRTSAGHPCTTKPLTRP